MLGPDGYLPAQEPRDQRARRRDRDRRGARPEQRPDHRELEPRAGARLLRRPGADRRGAERRLQPAAASLAGTGASGPGRPGAARRPGLRGCTARRCRPAPAARRPNGRPDPDAVLASRGAAEAAVARALLPRAGTLQEIVDATGLAPATVLAVLTRLEGDGLVVGGLGRYGAGGVLAATVPTRPGAGPGRAVHARTPAR